MRLRYSAQHEATPQQMQTETKHPDTQHNSTARHKKNTVSVNTHNRSWLANAHNSRGDNVAFTLVCVLISATAGVTSRTQHGIVFYYSRYAGQPTAQPTPGRTNHAHNQADTRTNNRKQAGQTMRNNRPALFRASGYAVVLSARKAS